MRSGGKSESRGKAPVEYSRVFHGYLTGLRVEGLLKLVFPSAPLCLWALHEDLEVIFKNADIVIKGKVVPRGKTV